MRYSDFINAMEGIGIGSAAQWCTVCQSANLFCPAFEDNSSGTSGSFGNNVGSGQTSLSPAIAGVIGAIVALAIIGLAVAAAAVLGGVRFYRADPKNRNSTVGGFKGAEKMASDADLSYAKGGVRHERTGSWELGGKKAVDDSVAAPAVAVVQTKGMTSPRTQYIDDDAISEIGHRPVSPMEGV